MVDRADGLHYDIGYGFSELDAEAARDRLDGYAVVSGLEVTTDGTNMTLDVSAGTATVGQTSGSVDTVSLGSADTVTIGAADPSNPRKDTIYIDANGDLQVESGGAEAADPSGNDRFETFQPEPPYPSTEGTILAEVWVAAGASAIESADIRDRRQPADITASTVLADSLTASDTLTDAAGVDHTDELADISDVGGGGVDVEDDGSVVVSDATAINMATNLSVTDDGDQTVSVDASGGGGIQSDDTDRIDVQSTAPSSPSTNDIWIDTS